MAMPIQFLKLIHTFIKSFTYFYSKETCSWKILSTLNEYVVRYTIKETTINVYNIIDNCTNKPYSVYIILALEGNKQRVN